MVGIGAIGCGSRLSGIILDALEISKEVKMVSLCDPREYSRENAKKDFGKDLKLYDDYKELVADPAIDWVFVGSWNCFHRDHVVAALENGKHVFCEKPLALSTEECIDIGAAMKKSRKKVFVGFVLRYSPHYHKIKEIIDSGRIGKIISFEFNQTLDPEHGGFIHGDWRRKREWGGTHMLEKCCHDLDLVNWLIDSVPARVASFGGTNFFTPENERHIKRVGPDKEGRPAYMSWLGYNPDIVNPFTADKDVVDNQVAIIQYRNGIRASFHTNLHSTLPERRMYIIGSEGSLVSDVKKGTILLKRNDPDAEETDEATGSKGGHGGGDLTLVESIVDCMLHDTEPITGFIDGLTSSVAAFAIDEAMDTGAVVDVEKYWRKIEAAK